MQEGTVDLVPVGPCEIFMAYGVFALEIFCFTNKTDDDESDDDDPPTMEEWCVCDNYETEEYTQTICAGPGRTLEITYLVIPWAIETHVEVRLNLKDLGSGSRAVYGKIKASATYFGNKSVHLFNQNRGRSLSFPSGSTSTLPLSPSVIALPCCRKLLHVEVDLIVITTCDSKEEQKNLKFSLEFNRGIMSQEREVDDDRVEVNITCNPKVRYYEISGCWQMWKFV